MQRVRSTALSAVVASLGAACTPTSEPDPPPAPRIVVDTVVVADTVRVEVESPADARLEEQVARLQIQLLEKEQQLRLVNDELAAARQEVVRNLAKLQSQATRAEAASGLSEAEIALEQLDRMDGGADIPEFAEAQALVAEGSREFNAENFGGALYLATQSRALARSGQARLRVAGGGSLRPGESLFAVPVSLRTVGRSNVRSGPGLDFGIRFTLDADVDVVGLSYTSQWVRIVDGQGREGWIFHTLVDGEGR